MPILPTRVHRARLSTLYPLSLLLLSLNSTT